MKKNRSKLILTLLSIYILLQFCWWGYLLVHANYQKTFMIIGEGFVFLSILIFGIWRLNQSIEKEIHLHQRQTNFLLSVSHELKTPLASVQLVLQTILKRPFDSDQLRSFAEQALTENKKSQELIETMLNASGIEQSALNAQIEIELPLAFLDSIKPYFPNTESCQFHWQIDTQESFLCDKSMLTLILKNLFDNSIKYGATDIHVHCHSVKKDFLIEVHDNGVGIDEKDQPMIFEKFYRSGDEKIRERSGTGLGLYIAREMAKLQHGNLIFKPLEKGSCFIISLPHVK